MNPSKQTSNKEPNPTFLLEVRGDCQQCRKSCPDIPNEIATNLRRIEESNPGVTPLWLLIPDHRQQPTSGGGLLIEKMIGRNPKRSVQSYHDDPRYQSSQHIGSHISRHKSNYGNNTQNAQHNFIIERLVEEDERVVAEEVEEQPADEDEQEHDDRNRVPEEAE